MQILCGLQVVFFLFNCQTPERSPPKRKAARSNRARDASAQRPKPL